MSGNPGEAPSTNTSIMGVTEKAEFLKNVTFFRKLSVSELNDIAAVAKETTYHEGDTVIQQGKQRSTLYIVTRGTVSIKTQYPSADGSINEAVLASKGPKEYFGEISFITDRPTTATASASEVSNVLKLDKTDFDRVIMGNPIIGFKFIAEFVKSISYRIGNIPKAMQEYILWKHSPFKEDSSMASSSDLDAISSLPLFKGFSGEEISRIKSITQVKNCFNGDIICKAGEQLAFLPIVKRGAFKVIKRDFEDQFHEVAEKLPGETFGVFHVFAGMPLEETVRAKMEGAIYFIPEEDLGKILLSEPKIGFKIIRNLIEHLSTVMDNIPQVYKNFVLWGFNTFEKVEKAEIKFSGGTPAIMKFLAIFFLIAGFIGGYFFTTTDTYTSSVEKRFIAEMDKAKLKLSTDAKENLAIQKQGLKILTTIVAGCALFFVIFMFNSLAFSSEQGLNISPNRCCENCKFFNWQLPGKFSCHKLDSARKLKDAKTAEQLLPGETMSSPTLCPMFDYVTILMLKRPTTQGDTPSPPIQ